MMGVTVKATTGWMTGRRIAGGMRWKSSVRVGRERLGIVFDIDGVLIRGKTVLPEAVRTIRKLVDMKVPFIFLTNGGGVTEEKRAEAMSRKFGVEIDPGMVVLSHSPMAPLAQQFRDDNVLILGKDTCKMMFHDSIDWGRDLQIACDLLRSDRGHVGTLGAHPTAEQSVPIFFSNGDFLWSNDFPQTRFAQGAFRVALEAMYKVIAKLTSRDLDYTIYGKPERATYDFAHKTLLQVAQKLYPHAAPDSLATNVYMVGDNPASDIEGANRYGWRSVLVRTGVYAGGQHFATHLEDDVERGVEVILRESL
ncbi:hypothetical protein HDU67_007486 [Dinochytrium kinnereticum]|nr:hypothetical protein HDU67_007486 [Dinochytrium kinnereticum]